MLPINPQKITFRYSCFTSAGARIKTIFVVVVYPPSFIVHFRYDTITSQIEIISLKIVPVYPIYGNPIYLWAFIVVELTNERRNYKTQNPKCRLYWCLIEFIDWRYSQSCWCSPLPSWTTTFRESCLYNSFVLELTNKSSGTCCERAGRGCSEPPHPPTLTTSQYTSSASST